MLSESQTGQGSVFHVDRYLDHFGLRQDPFALTADPTFMYLGEGHSEALAALEVGVVDHRGLVVVVGEVGTGKTTLAQYVLGKISRSMSTALVSMTTLSFEDLLISALKRYGLRNLPTGKRELLETLESFLMERYQAGGTVVLLVDEAQNLSDEVLEEFRLLLNFETPKHKLLQIVLLGQPELHGKLLKPSLRHVAARVAVRVNLNPLSSQDSRDYIAHRLAVAGGDLEVFSPSAVKALVKHAQGIPREINVNCHNALLFAFGTGARQVDRDIVLRAIESRQGEDLKSVEKQKRRRWLLALLIGSSMVALLLLAGAVGTMLGRRGVEPSSERSEATPATVDERPADTAESAQVPAPSTVGPTEDVPLTIVREPNGDYVVRVERGITLSELMLGVYGSFDPELLDRVLAANSQIRDPDLLRIGEIVRLPARVE